MGLWNSPIYDEVLLFMDKVSIFTELIDAICLIISQRLIAYMEFIEGSL